MIAYVYTKFDARMLFGSHIFYIMNFLGRAASRPVMRWFVGDFRLVIFITYLGNEYLSLRSSIDAGKLYQLSASIKVNSIAG